MQTRCERHNNVTQNMKSHNLSTERHICVFGVLEHKASHFSDLFFVCIIFCAIAIFSSFTSIVVTLSGAYTNSTSNDYTAAAAAATAVVATAPYIRNTFFAIVFCTSFFSQNISHGRTHAFVYTIDDEIVHYMCCIERERWNGCATRYPGDSVLHDSRNGAEMRHAAPRDVAKGKNELGI